MPNDGKDLFEFGPFRLDARERELSRAGDVVPLTGKAFEVLHLLVRNSGRTVTKEEFMAEVWAGTVVEEGNLTDNISTLRQALQDDAREPVYIQTVPRRGYRFVAAVEQTTPQAERARSRVLPRVAGGLIAVALAALALLLLRQREPATTPSQPIRSIAVFPFDPLGSDAGDTHLGVSLADSLITRLTNIDALIVRPARAVFDQSVSGRDAMLAARDQNVETFLEGRIRKRGSRVRITVQLVSVREARTLWARTFDEDASNLFAVEDTIADAVADELSVRMSDRARLARNYTPDPAAYELYGAGRYFWSRRTPDALEKSVDCFRRAIAIDPRFALAHAGLADAYSAIGIWNFKAPRETFPLAKEAALAALALDGDLAEARTSLAYVKFRYDWDLTGAGEEFRRALATKRNYATARALYGEYLTVMGRFDEAAVELDRARTLDPRSPFVAMLSAVRHYFMRNYKQAAAEVETLLRADPDFFIAREFLWAVYREAGDDDRSVANRLQTLRPNGVPASSVDSLRAVYRTSGVTAYRSAENDFLEAQSRAQYVPPIYLAMNYAENGENDLTMHWLEKAYDERSGWLVELRVDPVWDKVRDDPRFTALTEKVFGAPAR